MSAAPEPGRVTVLTARRPKTLSKRFERDADGNLAKKVGGALVEGTVEIRDVDDLSDFAAVLKGLRPNQALTYGVPPDGAARVFSRRVYDAAGKPDDGVTRTRGVFRWPAGPGVMMLDHDPAGDERLAPEELIGLVRKAAPGLADAALLWWPSASSHIHETRTGRDLTGLRGQRIYLLVADAADIPRAGEALVDRLWAAGHGRITISSSGAALERCPVDAAVWQPERLDFAAGAVCGPGLEQRRGEPITFPGIDVVDTRAALPDDAAVREEAVRRRREAKAAARPELEAAREAWCERQADRMLTEEERDDPDRRAAALATAQRAVQNGVLSGGWPIEVETTQGDVRTVTVARVLADPGRFHGLLTRDPLEPDYDRGRLVGKLFLLDTRPRLHSFARGARTFRLIPAPHVVEIARGRIVDAVDETVELLRDDPGVFDFGSRIAVVDDGRLAVLDEATLAHHLGGLIQFRRPRRDRNGHEVLEDVDPPLQLVRQLLALGARRRLKPVVAVVTAPTLRPDGTVLDVPGYDPETRLVYDPGADDPPRVPDAPTHEEIVRALDTLMRPFATFPFVDPLAEGACLAALLTAVLRPCLPTAPAFALDAPVQGSGKTLLASCLAVLATGRPAEIWPHSAGRDDEETRKRLLTALLEGAGALIWDNVVGVLDSASLAALLTSTVFRDRELGRSGSLSLPNRALFLITGNNICLAGDLPRRVIVCRIDPETATPFARRFDLEPLAWVHERRLEMSAAALVLVRGALSAGGQQAEGRMASFEIWDDLVRQTVCWIGHEIAPGRFGDPMDLVIRAQSSDPEQEALAALLGALLEVYGQQWFTAATVRKAAHKAWKDPYGASSAEKALAEALVDVGTERCLSSSRSLGRVLTFRTDRIVKGLRLRLRTGGKANEFRVERIGPTDDRRPDGQGEPSDDLEDFR